MPKRKEQLTEVVTERQKEILRLIADGMSNKQIAEQLTISINTVKWHVQQIFSQLQVQRRTEAVSVARNLGLLRPLKQAPHDQLNLPTPIVACIGREEELEHIVTLLESSTRLVTLHGAGGIGKTRLAIEVGQRAVDAFADGVFFIDLSPLRTPQIIPSAIADAMDFQFSGTSTPAEQVLTFVSNKQVLLILDNFEHLLDGRDFIVRLLQEAPHIKVLITSREKLSISTETLYPLYGLRFPTVEIDTADHFAAVQLFLQRANIVHPIATQPPDIQAIVEICQLVGGSPLALILAASWVNTLPARVIATEIRQNMDFLATDYTDLPERQRSIRAVYRASWQRLSSEERTIVSRLSVFNGGCSYVAAKHITEATLRELSIVANKSFLVQHAEVQRFSAHELLRQFAHERLEESGTAHTTYQAHAEYFLTWLADFEADLKGHDQVGALSAIDRDFENIRTAWLWAVENEQLMLLEKAFLSLTLYCRMRSRYDDGTSLLEVIESHDEADKYSQLLRMKIKVHQALLTETLSLSEEEYQTIVDACRVGREMEEPLLELLTDYLLALSHYHAGEYDDAEFKAQQSLKIAEQINDMYFQGKVSGLLFSVYVKNAAYQKAEAMAAKDIEAKRSSGDQYGLASALYNFKFISSVRGEDLTISRTIYEERLAIALRLNDLGLQGNIKGTMAIKCAQTNHIDEARQLADETLTIADYLNSDRLRIISYQALVLASIAIKDYTAGMAYTHKQIQLNYSDIWMAGDALLRRGFIACAQGRFADARCYLRYAVKHVPHNTIWKYILIRCMTQIVAHEGDYQYATEVLGLYYTGESEYNLNTEYAPVMLELMQSLKDKLGQEAYTAAWQKGTKLDVDITYNRLLQDYLGVNSTQ